MNIKVLIGLLAASVLSGCVAGSNVPHADGPGGEPRADGPALCRDGTAPPCTDRS